MHLKYQQSLGKHCRFLVHSGFMVHIVHRSRFHLRKATVLGPRLLQNPVNPQDPGLSALSLPLAHDEDEYRSYPQTKALCAPLQGLELAEAGYTVMREIEGRMGDQLIPNKDGDLYTKEKKEARWAIFFFFCFCFI